MKKIEILADKMKQNVFKNTTLYFDRWIQLTKIALYWQKGLGR